MEKFYGREQFRRKAWFLNGDLVSLHHSSKAAGVVTLENFTKGRLETMTFKDFRRFRKRAYTIREAAALLNREPNYLSRRAKAGYWPKPVGRGLNGEQVGTSPAFYSEDHLYVIRDLLAQTHHGRPRADGLISNDNTPTEAELRAAINDQLFVYVKDKDGNFIPTFDVFDSR